MKQHLRPTATLVLVVALAVAGCTPTSDNEPPAASVAVSPDDAATLIVPDGPTVRVFPGAVSEAGTLEASPLTNPPDPSEGTADAPVWDLRLVGATLVGDIELTLPYTPSDDELTVALAYYDETTSTWTPVPARVDSVAGTVTATVDHLSWWKPWTWKVPTLTSWFQEQIRQAVEPPRAEQPRCADEDRLRETARVASDSSAQVKWCAGLENGSAVLRVTNASTYATEVTFSTGWQVAGVAPALGIFDSMTGLAANALLFDPSSRIIGPGQTLTLTAPPGTAGQVTVIGSGVAYLLSALVLAAETYAMVTAKVPGGPEPDASRIDSALRAAWETTSCVDSMRELLVDGAPQSADDFAEHFQNALGVSFGCLADVWEDSYGVAGAVWAALAGVLTWATSAVRVLVTGVQALVDSFQDFDGYQIALTVSATPQTIGDDWVIGGFGVGPIRIGETFAELAEQFPEATEPGADECPAVFFDVDERHLVATDNWTYSGTVESVYLFSWDSPLPIRATTAAGVRIGSSVADLRAAYPDGTLGYANNGVEDVHVFRIEDRGVPVIFQLSDATDLVASIGVNTEEFPYEFCG